MRIFSFRKRVEDNSINTQSNSKWILLVMFVLSFISAVVFSTLYFFYRNKETKKRDVFLNYLDTGVVESRWVGNSENEEKESSKLLISAVATGVISEQETSSYKTGRKIAKISAVKFNLEDGQGNPLSIDLVVQIIPSYSGSNIIPWFIQNAYEIKEDKFLTKEIATIKDLSELFDKDSRWALTLLLKSNWQEGLLSYSDYPKYAEQYYTEKDWEYLEEAFRNKFNKFSFSKPLLIQRLQYLKVY